LVKYTYWGDTDLDGRVTSDDYGPLDANYPTTGGMTWATGDIDYDASVTGDDYFFVDFNFGAGTGGGHGPQL
jgi:hypothetical protein